MISKVVAKRYAKALFAVGKEDNNLDQYQQEMNGLAELLTQSPELQDGLTNAVYPMDVKVKLMNDLIGAVKLSPTMAKFANLLVEKTRILHTADIAKLLQQLIDDHMGVKRAVVTAAVPLNADTTKRIQQALEEETGKRIVLNVIQDPSIMGGLVVRAGDMVWDGSVRTQLLGLKEIIKRGEGL